MGEEGTLMKRRSHIPEQVVRKLREAERMFGEGKAIPEVAKELEISENTFHRWRAEHGGMRPAQGVGLVARDLAPQVTDHALCTTRGARPCGRAPVQLCPCVTSGGHRCAARGILLRLGWRVLRIRSGSGGCPARFY